VKVRGYRIELGEIESVLLAHEGVRDAVVVVREEAGDKQLVGYVVAEAGAQAGESTLVNALRDRLRERLPGYMAPSALMVLPSLPLTTSGKVDRQALPAPDGEAYARAVYEAPETAMEKALAQIWKENLGLERVGTADNYFSIGGDSIRSLALVAAAKRRGLRFFVKDLFTHRTIKALAQVVEVVESGKDELPEQKPFSLLTDEERAYIAARHEPAAIEDAFPLSTLQQGLIYQRFSIWTEPGLSRWSTGMAMRISRASKSPTARKRDTSSSDGSSSKGSRA
jgi:aryl carrier-like protein